MNMRPDKEWMDEDERRLRVEGGSRRSIEDKMIA